MYIALYPNLESIPEPDRPHYKQVTEQGSPNFGQFVLDLDPNHPVAKKNTELLGEKTTRETAHQTALATKDSQISNLTTQLEAAKTANALPAGHVAVPVENLQKLQQYEALGDVATVKTKVDEHGTLKANEAQQKVKELLEQVADRNGLDKTAFINLAMPNKFNELLEVTELPNEKGKTVKHDLVKTKDSTTGDDKKVSLLEYIKEDSVFKPFMASLVLTDEQKKKIKIPETKLGGQLEEKSAADAYLASAYKRPDAKKD